MVFESTERYLVERVLGEGGHGVVYEAIDRETGLKIALKTLRTLSPETLFEFKKEFRSIQNLNHPNLVELYDLGTAHGTWFFTMQLVEGHSVLEYVRPSSLMLSAHETTGRLDNAANLSLPSVPEPDTLQRQTPIPSLRSIGGTLDLLRLRSCMAQVAHGLMALHETGKVHRDIKPNNMLVTPQGRVVILDFGLAAEVSETSMPRSDTEISGTVAYMAPEQAAASSVGPAADWYALGVVLYECLSGRLPFAGNPMQVLVDKQRFDPPDPRQFSPDLPKTLAELALAMLAINPNDRPKGLEIVERLQAINTVDTVWASTAGTNAFVGREHELEVLERAFSQLHHGPQAVCISSESGLGKSTLLRQLIRKLERRMPVPLIL